MCSRLKSRWSPRRVIPAELAARPEVVVNGPTNGSTSSDPWPEIHFPAFGSVPPSRMMSTCCDAFETFQAVTNAIATTASTAATCAVRVTLPRLGTSERASTHTPANTTEPSRRASHSRYHPTIARNSPTAPSAATPAASTNAKTRIHTGSSYSSNDPSQSVVRRAKALELPVER